MREALKPWGAQTLIQSPMPSSWTAFNQSALLSSMEMLTICSPLAAYFAYHCFNLGWFMRQGPQLLAQKSSKMAFLPEREAREKLLSAISGSVKFSNTLSFLIFSFLEKPSS